MIWGLYMYALLPCAVCFMDTWPQRVALSFVHCVTLRNAVELWEASKLTPNTVVVMEGLCGTGNITYQTLILNKHMYIIRHHRNLLSDANILKMVFSHCLVTYWTSVSAFSPAAQARTPPETETQALILFLYASAPTDTNHQT